MKEDFPENVELETSWLEFDFKEYLKHKDTYQTELRKLNNIQYDFEKPIPTKSFLLDYYNGSEVGYLATFFKQIQDYIDKHTCDTWTFCSTEVETVDVNDDPYCDYEMNTNQYTVYAYVKSEEDFKESKEYQDQLSVVKQAYKELLGAKEHLSKIYNIK